MNNYDYLFKFIIIGDSSVGKSCLLLQYINKQFKTDHDTTIGVEFGTKFITLSNVPLKLQLWDTAGQESFRSIARSYYRGSIGALIVYDIGKKESFLNIERWLVETQTYGNPEMIIMLFGNKTDIPK